MEEYIVYWNARHETQNNSDGAIWHAVSQSFTTLEEATSRYESLVADRSVNGIHLAFRKWLRNWREDRGLGVCVPVVATITAINGKVLKVDQVSSLQDGQNLLVIRDGHMLGKVKTFAIDGSACDVWLNDFPPSATRAGDMLVAG